MQEIGGRLHAERTPGTNRGNGSGRLKILLPVFFTYYRAGPACDTKNTTSKHFGVRSKDISTAGNVNNKKSTIFAQIFIERSKGFKCSCCERNR